MKLIGSKTEGGLRTQGQFKKSFDNLPLITLITIVFNGEKYLEETILSVIGQTYSNFEYLVIDGGSSDGTLDIIKKYDGFIDYWLSENDEGISDAFNKGIRLSSGDIIGIINADDFYDRNALQNVVNVRVQTIDSNVIFYGDLRFIETNTIQKGDVNFKNKIRYIMPRLNHPTVFVSKDIYKKIGMFNIKYKVAMDYDFLLRAYLNGCRFIYIPQVLANMRLSGISNQKFSGLGENLKISQLKLFTIILYFYYAVFNKFKSVWNKIV